MAVIAWLYIWPLQHGYWRVYEEQGNYRSAVKKELDNIHWFKSFVKNKFDSKIMVRGAFKTKINGIYH